jgi:DNA-binding CsgD family transcriptional regulator/PAS domain-containing protein
MGGWLTAAYDEKRVASISSAVAEAIDAAALGTASWDSIPRVLGEAFPGSMVSFTNENFADKKVNFLSVHNIDPDFLRSYQDYYAFVNPWAAHWYSAGSGQVLVAEEHCPARLFADTEFYNNWLRPQKDIEAAVGIKIEGGARELVRMPMHYSRSLAGTYDRPAAEVLVRIRGNLQRAVDLGRLLRTRTEDAVAGAALVERACCAAFVIDGDRHLREANQEAVDMFSSGPVAVVRHGSVCLLDARADRLFREGVSALSRGLPTSLARIPFCLGERNLQVSLASLPAVSGCASGVLSLFPARSMVLVLVKDLNARLRNSGDLSALAAQHRLTRAEILLCERLIKGASLAEAAVTLGIRVETARDRVKAIFHKTGTHRQGELVAMLAAFG